MKRRLITTAMVTGFATIATEINLLLIRAIFPDEMVDEQILDSIALTLVYAFVIVLFMEEIMYFIFGEEE